VQTVGARFMQGASQKSNVTATGDAAIACGLEDFKLHRRSAMVSETEAGSSPAAALAFFDPVLAGLPVAVPLLRAVLCSDRTRSAVQITPDDWPVVIDRLLFHRILPQLSQAARFGTVVLEPAMLATLDSLLFKFSLNALRLDRLLVQVGNRLNDENIQFRVLKGIATAHLDHEHPEDRIAVDVDLLLPPHQLALASETLMAAGYDSPYEIESLMDKGRTLRDVHGGHVDLHVRPHAPAKTLGSDWWDAADHFEVGGRTFSALPRGARLAHAASHLTLSWPSARRFSSLLDMMVIVSRAEESDRRLAERFLSEIGVSDIVSRVTSRAALILDRPDLRLGHRGNRPIDRMLRRAYDRSDDDKVAMKFTNFFGMPRNEQRDVVSNWVNPSAEFLDRGGYSSRTDRLGKVLRRAVTRSDS
jgi:hypothetical protein